MTASPAYNREVDKEGQKAAIASIDARIKEAQAAFDTALAEVQKIADEHDIEIYINVGGAGQTYVPNLPEDWNSSSCVGDSYYERGSWLSSSMRC